MYVVLHHNSVLPPSHHSVETRSEEKARKALEEDNKRQVDSIHAELAQLRAAAGTGSREAVLEVLTESEQGVKADMAETKRFSNHTHDYIKTKMTGV